jgi:hypothetical protein
MNVLNSAARPVSSPRTLQLGENQGSRTGVTDFYAPPRISWTILTFTLDDAGESEHAVSISLTDPIFADEDKRERLCSSLAADTGMNQSGLSVKPVSDYGISATRASANSGSTKGTWTSMVKDCSVLARALVSRQPNSGSDRAGFRHGTFDS